MKYDCSSPYGNGPLCDWLHAYFAQLGCTLFFHQSFLIKTKLIGKCFDSEVNIFLKEVYGRAG